MLGSKKPFHKSIPSPDTASQSVLGPRDLESHSERNAASLSWRNSAIATSILCGLQILSLVSLFLAGCNRAYYRNQADEEAYALMDEKQQDSGEVSMPLRIAVDRRSRMFDPFNPDRPPMPEDDAASNRYMELVDGKKGYPLWKANGTTNTAESPDWWATLPLDERGVLVLNSDDAVRLALLHSPNYQQNLETLYLSAIDVSSERFLLDTQFYSGWGAQYTAFNGGSTVTASPFRRGSRPLTIQRRFATGADLLVGIANSITWQLSGPDTQSANTILDFTFIQPLLRQAGRDVVLERLTLAERTLLSNVRAFEQYRRGFYLQVVTGRGADAGPSRRGGVFGGAGLEGFTGLGGGFGRVAGGGGGGGAGFAGDGGVPQAGGFIGLLQDQLQIQNQEENVARLRDNLLRLEDTLRELLTTIPATQETIPRQQLQVSQAQQALFSAQSQLLNAKAGFEQSLDAFKRTMGLPPYICIELRDPLLSQFQLISSDLKQRRNQTAAIRDAVGRVNFELLGFSQEQQDPQTLQSYRTINRTPEVANALTNLRSQLSPVAEVNRKLLEEDIPRIEGDLQRLIDSLPKRSQQLGQLQTAYEREKELICTLLPKPDLDTQLFSDAEIKALPNQLQSELNRLRDNFTSYRDRISALDKEIADLNTPAGNAATPKDDYQNIRDKAILASQSLIASLSEDVLALQLIEARARTESIVLPDIELEPRDAVEVARRNRRDWMNARASLVNSWRAIELVADELESFLDVVFSGDIRNSGNNPLSLDSATGRLRVGLQWDAPITRLQERNRYRQALIEYQQAKRSYYQFEDNIWTLMRAILRTIRANQVNFELQRYSVRIAAQQIVLNEDIRQINEALSQASGPTAARDTVSALQDLLNAQNTFLGVWVNYEVLRRTLDQELGTMQLDSEGLWVDPGPLRLDTIGAGMGLDGMNMQAAPYGTPEEIQGTPIEPEMNANPNNGLVPGNQGAMLQRQGSNVLSADPQSSASSAYNTPDEKLVQPPVTVSPVRMLVGGQPPAASPPTNSQPSNSLPPIPSTQDPRGYWSDKK
ncbi:MAG: hypothetical protein RLY14_273 [Planctomycetota bacterium]|jgi:hypothetical protein